jgi:hypothetical protein
MRSRSLLLVMLVFTAWWVAAPSAQELTLIWEMDQTPAAESFLFTVMDVHDPQHIEQFRVTNAGRASCDSLSTAPGLSAESVCGRTPACYPPGTYTFWVQAEAPGFAASDASNMMTCVVGPQCVYDCQTGAAPPEIQALVNRQAPPDGAAVQRTVDDLSQRPTPLPPPSVDKPPPTIDDVLDTITPALQALAPGA